jgi:PD-(D/E)XK endonuclease
MDTAIRRDPRGQGDQGERSAISWLLNQDLPVFLPVGHSPDIDLITLIDHQVVRVQVKTSSVLRKGRWDVTVCTRGGNQSWNGLVKQLDPSRYDRLFVLVGDGRRWFIPSNEVEGTCGVRLGGPKYERFEIEPGLPLRMPVAR